MNLKRVSINTLLSVLSICALPALASCNSNSSTQAADTAEAHNSDSESPKPGWKAGGPQLGKPGGGPAIDKSGDPVLQAMIEAEVPQFKQLEYHDATTGITMKYNLFAPSGTANGQKYPLVLFIADASTPGADHTTPLTQGYGALVWATKEWQEKYPCYVLVPQFSGVAVNDAYEHTDEVNVVIRMLSDIVKENDVDINRLYTTGQSMGGMISMYYNLTYPDLFAASIFVDCHWDTTNFKSLAHRKFAYITAGESGKSYSNITKLEDAAESEGIKYEYARWSAKLPQAEQDSLATAMLAKGAPINIINFAPGSVLPDDGKGSEHMYSFDYAYKLTPVREWLFRQSK